MEIRISGFLIEWVKNMLSRYDWQPGNGTRYDLFYGKTSKETGFISWMKFGGASGVSMAFTHYLHYTYIMEKMQISITDAVGILMFLEELGHAVGYPEHDEYEKPVREPYIKVLE